MVKIIIVVPATKFPLGQIVITTNADAHLAPATVQEALSRHAAGDWGDVCPDDAELNAEALEIQGKWDEAAKEYRLVLQKNPRLPGIHFRLGRLLLSRPNPGPTVAEDAKKEMQQELEIDPTNAGAEYVLGELARQAQDLDEAVKHFSKATELNPNFADAYLGLGMALLAEKKYPEAVAPLEKAVKLQPANPAGHYSLATDYSRTGRREDADREFALQQKTTPAGPQGAPPPQ